MSVWPLSDSEVSVDEDEYDDDSDTRRTSDQMPSTSHQEGEDGASRQEQVIDLEVEEAKQLIKIFHAETQHILSNGSPSDSLHELDGESLPAGLILQRVPEVSSGEPEQVRGDERVRPPNMVYQIAKRRRLL